MTESEIVRRLRASGSVFAEKEAALLIAEASAPDRLEAMVAQRVHGLPIEQIVGWAEFDGLRFVVEPGVFVPRHRTEFLVQQAAGLGHTGAVVLDLCCGVGALGVATRARLGQAELHAADVDLSAVRCAAINVGPSGRVYVGDLFAPLPESLRGRVELLLANAPYVPSAEIVHLPLEAREHEHPVALDGGADGLDVQRRVIAEAPAWLVPGGHLLIEASAEQASAAAGLMTAAGLSARIVPDEEDEAIVVIGIRAA